MQYPSNSHHDGEIEMPLFRNHRGLLADSLKTTVIVKNMDDLRSCIYKSWEMWEGALRKGDTTGFSRECFDIKIEPYGSGFDERCGWYTQIVCADLEEKEKFLPVGWLSEPMI